MSVRITTRSLAVAVLAVALCAGSVSAQQFITFPGWATDVTPDGSVVVGSSQGNAFYWRWQVDPAPVLIGATGAVGVSDDGTVIAGNQINPATGKEEAARWTEATGWVLLGGFGSCDNLTSSAFGITANGKEIVGLAWVGCAARGFRWTEGVGMELLQNLANGGNRCSTISSNGGVMGGFAQGTSSRTPAIWGADTSGAVWDINSQGEVLGLNNNGSVTLGTRFFSGSSYSAFMNSSATGLVNLGKLQPTWAAAAYDISEDGQTIVGFDYQSLNRKAWVWKQGEGIISLQSRLTTLGVPNVPDLSVALACSDSGKTIVGGYAFQTAYIATLGPEPWTQLGAGIAGSNGTPVMYGTGTLQPSSPAGLTITHGRQNGTANMIVGFSALLAPFKQGVLVPHPNTLLPGLPLDVNGALQGPFTWPIGLPSGFSIYWQAWIADPAAPAGFASTNGLRSTTP
jgi:hypothetical protein